MSGIILQLFKYLWSLTVRKYSATSISGVSINGEPLLAGNWGMGDLNFQGVIIPIQNGLYKWGEWRNPNVIVIKLYCISNKSTLKFHRINIVDGSTLMFSNVYGRNHRR